MRPFFAVALLITGVLTYFLWDRAIVFDPGEGVEVRVLTTDPVVVWLTEDPDVEYVRRGIRAALLDAADRAVDEDMAAELSDLADDYDYLTDLAANGLARLETDAAALAYGSHAVYGRGDTVTVIAVTIELLPRGRHEGISRDHEDGHAYINNEVVEACSAAVVQAEIERGRTGTALVGSVIDHLELLEVQAHTQYHGEITDVVSGTHFRAAQRAVAGVVADGCLAR